MQPLYIKKDGVLIRTNPFYLKDRKADPITTFKAF